MTDPDPNQRARKAARSAMWTRMFSPTKGRRFERAAARMSRRAGGARAGNGSGVDKVGRRRQSLVRVITHPQKVLFPDSPRRRRPGSGTSSVPLDGQHGSLRVVRTRANDAASVRHRSRPMTTLHREAIFSVPSPSIRAGVVRQPSWRTRVCQRPPVRARREAGVRAARDLYRIRDGPPMPAERRSSAGLRDANVHGDHPPRQGAIPRLRHHQG